MNARHAIVISARPCLAQITRKRAKFRVIVPGVISEVSPWQKTEKPNLQGSRAFFKLAGWTGLEPAAFCVTGRRSNQLSYHPETGKRTANVEPTKR
jgi:hypothetical protein